MIEKSIFNAKYYNINYDNKRFLVGNRLLYHLI